MSRHGDISSSPGTYEVRDNTFSFLPRVAFVCAVTGNAHYNCLVLVLSPFSAIDTVGVCVFQYSMPRLHTTEEVMANAKKICEIVVGTKMACPGWI
jgi:hypothetical protein